MAMKKHNNTYGKGLNVDTAFDSMPNSMYIDAMDIRITTADGESTGAITNLQGNEEAFKINQAGATGLKEIIGIGFIRNIIILFCADDTGTNGWMYYVTYDEQTRKITSGAQAPLLYDGDGNPNLLGFSKDWPIEAQGRYESDCVQRIYWTDYNNSLRSLLIEDFTSIPAGGLSLDISVIDIFPEVTYTQPILTNVAFGGTLLAGEYQFAYRLITEDGKQTLISPPGNLIHLTSDSEATSTSRRYMGDPKGTNTNKSLEITIDTSDYVNKFERIELISLFFEEYGGTPVVQSVETQGIGVLTEISFIYTGQENTIVDLPLAEFAIKVYPFSTCKTMIPKDNSLVVANIKQTKFDINELLGPGETLDLMTKRYNNSSELPFTDGLDNPLAPVPNTPYEEKDEIFNLPYNLDQHWEGPWHEEQQFKYQADGSTMGGQSLDDGVNPSNLSYKFALSLDIIDDSSQPGLAELTNTFPNEIINLNDGYTYTNKSFRSKASPYKSGLTRGYKRGEVYRFGIVFYNKKGESSYVEYIGDIKMPDISEEAGYTTVTVPGPGAKDFFPISSAASSGATVPDDYTYGHDLGLKIDLDFTSCPSILDKITSFQIVRCKRTDVDKRRPASGIIKSYHFPDIGTNPHYNDDGTGEGYDWETPEGNILHLYWTKPTVSMPSSSGKPFAGSWYSFNNNWNTYQRFADDENYSPIYGDFLAFYSPEVSYNFNRQNLEGAGKALLITGSYADYGLIWQGASSTTRYYTSTLHDEIYGTTQNNQELGCDIWEQYFKVRTTNRIDRETVAEQPDGTLDTVYDGGAGNPISYRGIEYVRQFNNAGVFTDFEKAQEDVEPVDRMSKIIKTYGPLVSSPPVPASFYIRPVYVFVENEGAVGTDDPDDCPCAVSQPGRSLGGNNCGYGGIGRGSVCLTVNTTNIFTNPYTSNPVTVGSSGVAFPTTPTNAVAGSVTDPCFGGPSTWTGSFGYVWPEFPDQNFIPSPSGNNFLNNIMNTPVVDVMLFKQEIYGGYTNSALQNNIFVPCSPVVTTAPVISNLEVYGGDTFIGMYSMQTRSMILDEPPFPNGFTAGNDEYRYEANGGCTEAIPVETQVNLDLAMGGTYKTNSQAYWVYSGVAEIEGFLRQEVGNLSDSGGSGTWAKVNDAYNNAYNEVYSVEPADNTLGFFIKPGSATGCGVNDIRAFLSDVKINEEEVDSWSIFRANNYYDIEAQFGPINKIENWRDEVFFFQDTGVGKYSINPRAVTTTEDGIPTQLGSGQGFQHHQYLSTENGSIHQWAVKATDTGIYYFDAMNKKIFRIGGQGNEPLSTMKGMHGFLANFNGTVLKRKETDQAISLGGDNPTQNRGVVFSRDQQNDEVLMTFLGMYKVVGLTNNTNYEAGTIVQITPGGGGTIQYWIVYESYTSDPAASSPALQAELSTKASWVDTDTREGRLLYSILQKGDGGKSTLVFDEVAQAFSSFYSATPGLYIENSNILMSAKKSKEGDEFIAYTHNKGKYGEFYGNIEESSISLVINPDADINKILRFIEFGSQVKEIGGDIDRSTTITAFRVENEYQDTTKTAYSPSNIKRRFDKWRVKLPRDQRSSSKRGRLRSTHFVLTLYFNNLDNKELVLNRITSHYDVQVY